jgi:hypothetical protein
VGTLFQPDARFEGLPRDGFGLFRIRDRDARRRAILDTIHPPLHRLGEDLLERLEPRATDKLHFHLPRLDWPRGYQPFATWLALSREPHGYQGGPQLNVGVHADHVALRLGWDCSADAFGRFEFLCRHGDLGPHLLEVARANELQFRVYAAAAWPEGSRLVFESADDVAGSFSEVRTHGVWWELGRRHDLPAELDRVCSPAFGVETAELFEGLLPDYERIAVAHAG